MVPPLCPPSPLSCPSPCVGHMQPGHFISEMETALHSSASAGITLVQDLEGTRFKWKSWPLFLSQDSKMHDGERGGTLSRLYLVVQKPPGAWSSEWVNTRGSFIVWAKI